MVAVKNSREVHIETQRQYRMYSISSRAMRNWHGSGLDQNQQKGTSSYPIHVDSKAALLAIANKLSTHPLAVDTRRKIIELWMTTTITFHWIKGHTGLKGNKRADYLAKTVASYNPNITYDAIPVSRGKQLLEDYYSQIWDATYINSGKASHTKPLIPAIFRRKSLSL